MSLDISWLGFTFLDWIACIIFLLAWIGYSRFAVHKSKTTPTIMSALRQHRHNWMWNATTQLRAGNPRDIIALSSFDRTVSFFASTTILILAGLLTLLGSSEKIASIMSSLHFASNTGLAQIQAKISLIIFLFVHAFFKFCWSMRCYNFLITLLGSIPMRFIKQADGEEPPLEEIDQWSQQAGGIMNSASHHFNLGLRAYYFALAILAWFIHPMLFILANILVVAVLYRRDFKSQVLGYLHSSLSENPHTKIKNEVDDDNSK